MFKSHQGGGVVRHAHGTPAPAGRPHSHDGHACSCGHEHMGRADPNALISARGLVYRRNGRTLIDHVDLDVMPGEIITLIGPNGAGKTTLVKLMLGIDRPDSGEIVRPQSTVIGYVPQSFNVDRAIPMTVRRFLTLGGAASQTSIDGVLADTGAQRVADQQLWQLSGGELQRVLIARALLRDPNFLVLDEPASGVDYAGEADLYDLIARLSEQRRLGVLLISHDLHVVMAKSDRVVCLNGHVCCSGKPETVSQHPEYVRLFGPAVASSFGVYTHHHDHAHDISGAALPIDPSRRGQAGT